MRKAKEVLITVMMYVVAVAVIAGVILAVTFGGNALSIKLKETFGVAHADADRKIFENTKTYVGGMADDLAKYKYEFQKEKDPVAKQAIVDLVVSRFADFDVNELNDKDLREFLKDARNGNLNQEIGGNN